MRTRIIALAVSAIAACGTDTEGEQPWRFDEDGPAPDVPEAVDDADGEGEEAVAEMPDEAVPESCEPEMQLIVADRTLSEPSKTVVVEDDRVFLTVVDAERRDVDVMEWAIEEQASRLAPVDQLPGTQIPIDGGDGRLWTVAEDVLRSYSLTGDDVSTFEAPGVVPATQAGFAQPRQYVAGGLVGWLNGGTLRLYREGRLVFERADAQPGIWVAPDGVAWVSMRDDTWSIHFTEVGGAEQTITRGEEPAGWPVVLGGTVLFVDDGEVYGWDLATDEVVPVLTDLTCGPLHTDGETAITACNYSRWDGLGETYDSLGAEDVFTIDGATLDVTEVEVRNDARVYSPVVDGRWIAWIEHDREPYVDGHTPTLGDDEESYGNIVVQSLATGDVVASPQVGRGCWACSGTQWPPPIIDIGGDTIAFNYGCGQIGRAYSGNIGVLRLPSEQCGDPDSVGRSGHDASPNPPERDPML